MTIEEKFKILQEKFQEVRKNAARLDTSIYQMEHLMEELRNDISPAPTKWQGSYDPYSASC